MKLIIAEKPSVASEISKVVGADRRKDGFFEGNGYVVSWCVGHLVSLAPPEAYGEDLKMWNIQKLPILPHSFKTQVLPGTKKQFDILHELMLRNDINELICATDAGREGELIFRLVYEQTKCSKPFKRLWVSSLVPSAIQKALENAKCGSHYDNLYYAARCRQRADWLIGINLTRLYTTKYGKVLKAGRVQTPTLNLLVERQNLIDNFIPVPYFNVYAEMEGVQAVKKFTDKQTAYDTADKIKDKKARVSSVLKENKKERMPKLFDLTALQREANRLFGFSAKQTLDTAQSLYEMKLITYPRTDSNYLTSDMLNDTKQLVNNLTTSFSSWLTQDINITPENVKLLINDKKVSDHHALIPTEQFNINKYEALPSSERKIAVLILFRLLEAISTPFIYESTNAEFEIEGLIYSAAGRIIKEQGFKQVRNCFLNQFLPERLQAEKKESILPPLNENDILTVTGSLVSEKKTQPPKPYTEDTLLAAMETAGKTIADELLREAMKDCGLGTPATRAETIESLIKNGYAVREKKNILPTDTAKSFISIVAEDIKEPDMTAKWEQKLHEISNGQYDETDFMKNINQLVSDTVQKEKQSEGEISFKSEQTESYGSCPLCGSSVLKKQKFFSCSAGKESCGFLIWKRICEKEITENAVKKLLDKGRTDLIKGFTSKAGKKFDAYIELDENGKTSFSFKKK